MKKRLLLLIIIVTTTVSAQTNHSKLLDNYIDAYTSVHRFSGNILVAKKGKIIYQKCIGQANREWQIANTPDTRFIIGSLTKQFTAAAILQLEEKGMLTVEDKVSKHFPGFPNGDLITLHMLLNHTSGLKSDGDEAEPDVYRINPNIPLSQLKDTLIGIFKHKPLEFTPGTSWRYCNSGYILLGYIIEQVSGETYRDYIFKHILQKCGMQNTDLVSQDSIIPNFASGYNLSAEKKWKKAKTTPMNVGFSAGGLYSTVDDLLKWNVALQSGEIISKASFDKMHTPHYGDRGAGYGIFIDNIYNHKVYEHQGALEGYNTFMARYPEDDMIIIVLTNKDTNLDFLPKTISAIMFGKKAIPPHKRTPITVDTKTLNSYTGTYEGNDIPFPINIILKEDKLYLRMHRDIELVPESKTTFYISEPDVEIQMEFTPNNGKPVTVSYFIGAGLKAEARRKI